MATDKAKSKAKLTLVKPDAAGLAALYTRLTGKAATAEEMQALIDKRRAKKKS